MSSLSAMVLAGSGRGFFPARVKIPGQEAEVGVGEGKI